MRGRDVILVMLVVVAVGALSMVGFWMGSFQPQGENGKAADSQSLSGQLAADGGPAAPQQAAAERSVAPQGVGVAPVSPDASPAAREASVPTGLAELAAAGGGARSAQESRPAQPGDAVEASPEIDKSTARVDVNDPKSFPDEPGRSFIDLDTNRPDERVDIVVIERQGLESPGDEEVGDGPDKDRSPDDPAMQELRKVPDDALREAALDPDSAEFAKPAAAPSGAEKEGEDVDDRPTFDLVRVAADGSAVVAGRATPGAFVAVIVDGVLAEEVRANSRGEFVALIQAPKQGALTRRLDLETRTPEGATLATSLAPVIVTLASDPGEAPLVVQPSEDGVDLMQPTAKVEKGRVTIESVSYGEKGEVLIGGRGGPGMTARVYLDNAMTAEATVSPDGQWRVRIAQDIKPAVYALRVDQMTTEGVVISRAETPFEREAVEEILLRAGTVVVQPGNNLWRIADYVYGDGLRYTVIYRTNQDQIRDPDLIYPGQILDLPEDVAAN